MAETKVTVAATETEAAAPTATEAAAPTATEAAAPTATEAAAAPKATEAAAPTATEAAAPKEADAEKTAKAEETKDNGEATQNGNSKEKDSSATMEVTESEEIKNDPELNKKIIKQIEYYFGNYNLPRDKFLSAEVKKDDGWVLLSTMLKFARLAALSKNPEVIINAIKEAEGTFMEVDESGLKIRRSATEPLPELSEGLLEESIKRTIYCKGFPKDGSVTLDLLLEYFKTFGEYDSVRMRNYVDKTSSVQGFKGSVLVVFKTVELAKAFLEAPPVQYKKTYLIRKWFADYLEEKKKEVEERRAKKLAKLGKSGDDNGQEKQMPEFAELPRGNFLRATGFAENTMREDIKEAVLNLTNDCAFVDFRKGDETAFLRFSEADSNKTMLAALEGNLVVNEKKISLFIVEGEEEEAQLVKANEARRKSHAAGPYTKKRKMGGGGYGGRGGRGRGGRNKRARHN